MDRYTSIRIQKTKKGIGIIPQGNNKMDWKHSPYCRLWSLNKTRRIKHIQLSLCDAESYPTIPKDAHTITIWNTLLRVIRGPVQSYWSCISRTLCGTRPGWPDFFQHIFELETGVKMLQVLIYLIIVFVWGRGARDGENGETKVLDGLDTARVVRLGLLADGLLARRFGFAQSFWRVAHCCKWDVVSRPVTTEYWRIPSFASWWT